MRTSDYVKGLQADAALASQSQQRFLEAKSEQQRSLEALLAGRFRRDAPVRVADIACGHGHVCYHLAGLYPFATFALADLNRLMLDEARRLLGEGPRFEYRNADVQRLPAEWAGRFDCVVCWQTLSWLDDYRVPVAQLAALLRPGGFLYVSTLINMAHDVDVYARVVDHTRPSSRGHSYQYNTYSWSRFESHLRSCGLEPRPHPFEIGVDLPGRPAGLGTYTLPLADGRRLQVSGGMLMNWVIVEAEKG
jgi:ubiquinone/menaquinone biosynthesis C-methylase UbiE